MNSAKMNNSDSAPRKLTVAGLKVEWYARPNSFYVEAFGDIEQPNGFTKHECVLAVEWTPDGMGEGTIETDDTTSDAVFAAVRAAYLADSARN
jgi:hypothetical protein